MREKLSFILAGTLVLFAVVITSSLFGDTASALTIQDGVNAARGTNTPGDLFGSAGVITTLTNILLFVVGGLAVVMLIVGGLRYVISGGNATSVTAAKNTILYAVVGLIIAFLAFAAINFLLGTLMPGPGPGFSDR